MKDLLDNNEINLKDKYIEFLFYFLKKFDDPDAKLEDLKYSLLNEIVPLGDTTVHSKAFVNKEKDKEEENIDLDNIENLNENEKKDDLNNNDIINIEENKEINFNLEKSKENDKMNKTDKSNQNKEENIFEKNKKKNKKNSHENSSINKAKQESKKDNSTPKDNSSDKNKGKDLNADIFDNLENNDSQNNDSSINNMAKINDNENIKENNDSDYIFENSKDIGINNIIGDDKKEKNKDIENNINNNQDKKRNDDINVLKETPKLKSKSNSRQISGNTKDKENKRPTSVKKYQEDEIAKKTDSNQTNGNEINNILNNKTEGEKIKTNENEDDSVTEITNEDFIRHIKESLTSIQSALESNSLEFIPFIEDNVKKMKINEEEYDYINIEDLNEKLVGIDVVLSDMQLSCLCSKYSLPNELRLINVKSLEKSLEENKNGNIKL
jgi:hypothetical protein